jgi:hypothetical protein
LGGNESGNETDLVGDSECLGVRWAQFRQEKWDLNTGNTASETD